MLLLFPGWFSVKAQDYSGVWEGEYTLYGRNTVRCELNIISESGHKTWYALANTELKNKKGAAAKPTQTIMEGRVSGDSLYLTEIASWAADQVTGMKPAGGTWAVEMVLKLYDNNGVRSLKGKWLHKEAGTREVEFVNKASEVPITAGSTIAEARKSLVITDYSFSNDRGTDKMAEKSNATFTFRIRNTGKFIFKNIVTTMSFPNDINKSIIYSLYDNSTNNLVSYDDVLYPAAVKDVTVLVTSKMNIPVDSLAVAIEMAPLHGGKMPFSGYHYSLPTDGFMKTTKIEGADWNSPRLKIVGSFYGMAGYKYNVRAQLEKLSQAGDKKAQLWECVFMYMGQAGYEPDEQMVFYRARVDDAFADVCKQAENGDVEAMYLAAIGYKMRLRGINTDELADGLLDKAVKNNFAPALYTFALKRLFEKKDNDARYFLGKAIDNGIAIAKLQLEQNSDTTAQAIPVYEKLAAGGNPDALLVLSDIYRQGKVVARNNEKAIGYAKAAAAINSNGKIALANLYLANASTEAQGIKLKQEAAASGNRDAIFDLALVYLFGKNKSLLNPETGIDLLKKAAQHGQSQAMNLLGAVYLEGKLIPQDNFLGRFWLNQAKAKGVGEGLKEKARPANPMMDFLSGVLTYRPSYYYEVINRYGNVISSGYADNSPLDYILWGGVANVLVQSRQQRQEFIDDIRPIYTRGNITTYGGLLTSAVKLPFRMKPGMIVDTYAEGSVSLGTFAGRVDADGMKFSENFRMFSRVPDLPHGSVLMGAENGNWRFAGKCSTGNYTTSDVNLLLGVNDRDYKNNLGYFDIRVDVFSVGAGHN